MSDCNHNWSTRHTYGGSTVICTFCRAKANGLEIERLRTQLAQAEEENQRLVMANKDAVAWEAACKADLDKALAENEALRAGMRQYETLTDEMDAAIRRCYLSGPTVVGQFKRLRTQAAALERQSVEGGSES